ncbi:MAG: TlyA family RNA methyltransferase [Acidimicrobiales bacterium]
MVPVAEFRSRNGNVRVRLDRRMVELGIAQSGEQARALISNGRVLVSGSVALKPSRMLALAEPVVVTTVANDGYASRGGVKLGAALDRYSLDVSGMRCLDAGASTGGFTDCLLRHGVSEVLAVDVGSGQLHTRVRDDPRVRVLDRTNVRRLDLDAVQGRPFDMVVADLSFISLKLLASTFTGELVRDDSCLLLLVKPQFEAGRKIVSQGKGIVRDAEVHAEVLIQVAGTYVDAGARVCSMMPSPIRGAKGNVEYFIYLRTGNSTACRFNISDTMDTGSNLSLQDYARVAVAEASGKWPV